MAFFDLSDRYASLDAKKNLLLEISGIVTWEEFCLVWKRGWRKPEAEQKSLAGRK